MNCPTCHGNGEIKCPKCSSECLTEQKKEKGDCNECHNTTFIPCTRCNGSGHLEQGA